MHCLLFRSSSMRSAYFRNCILSFSLKTSSFSTSGVFLKHILPISKITSTSLSRFFWSWTRSSFCLCRETGNRHVYQLGRKSPPLPLLPFLQGFACSRNCANSFPPLVHLRPISHPVSRYVFPEILPHKGILRYRQEHLP